jgi:RHS repeat-associated protein
MQWDFKDQLQQVDLGGGGTAYYVYDAAGQRVRKVVERSAGLREERIYLGGFEVFRRYGGSGLKLERETLHVMDDQRRIALVETKTVDTETPVVAPVSVIRYQLDNHLGSASLELDGAGQVISYEEYTPYGTTSYQAGRSVAEVSLKRYRYTGMERDEETGLAYHGARYYTPWLGRWVNCDPIGIGDGFNLYKYAEINPLKFTDANGKTTVIIGTQKDLSGPHAKPENAGEGRWFKDRADRLKTTMVSKGSRAENINAESVDTGAKFLDALERASAKGPIKNLVVYGHSWVNNLIMKWDEGFFDSKYPNLGPDARNVDDLNTLMSTGKVRFDKDAIAIFASCGCGGGRAFEDDKFAAKFTLKTGITSIAAVGLTAPKNEGNSDAKQQADYSWVKIERVSDGKGGFTLKTTTLPNVLNPIDYVKKDDTPPATVGAPAPPATVGAPAPPATVGAPAPPATVGAPAPPATVGVPAPPATVGAPAPPATVGVPAPPATVGAPAPSANRLNYYPDGSVVNWATGKSWVFRAQP